jgi:GrpB-like predicted nucleotidyltransferase (UPF0157 family)
VAAPIIVPYDSRWPETFKELQAVITSRLGTSVLSVDHVGSTSVPGLAAKDVIDIQVSVRSLKEADTWPDRLGPFRRGSYNSDHVPPNSPAGPGWEKRYWFSDEPRAHLHVREVGRANHRYALLFRDYLRRSDAAAVAYERVKRTLADLCADVGQYSDAKDPVCDLIVQAAERWALQIGWSDQLPADTPG